MDFSSLPRLNPGGMGNAWNMALFINLEVVKEGFVQLGETMLGALVIF